VSRSSPRFLALTAPFLFAVLPGALEPQSPPRALCYEGEIGAGTRVRRVIYAAEQSGSSATSGTLYFYGRPTQLLPMSYAPTSSRAVRAVGRDGVTSIEWSPDSSNVARLAMLRGRDTVATVLRATSPPTGLNWAIGDWTGMVGDGFATRLGIHVEAGPCGLLVGVLDSPDQGQNGLPPFGSRPTRSGSKRSTST
jgi:hypothetical protein